MVQLNFLFRFFNIAYVYKIASRAHKFCWEIRREILQSFWGVATSLCFSSFSGVAFTNTEWRYGHGSKTSSKTEKGFVSMTSSALYENRGNNRYGWGPFFGNGFLHSSVFLIRGLSETVFMFLLVRTEIFSICRHQKYKWHNTSQNLTAQALNDNMFHS